MLHETQTLLQAEKKGQKEGKEATQKLQEGAISPRTFKRDFLEIQKLSP